MIKRLSASYGLALVRTAVQAAPEPARIAMIEGLSGSFANAGEAVYRNLLVAVERVNAWGAGARCSRTIRPSTRR